MSTVSRSSLPGLRRSLRALFLAAAIAAGAGCATRPVNPPIDHAEPAQGYSFAARDGGRRPLDLVVLAFSGGGTRAAAFSYGALETLRATPRPTSPAGPAASLLDAVSVITGVSGGSFTALAYALYGERLFGEYERRFLERDVEAELILRLFQPGYWGALSSTAWGRSELAADYYDEILFDGATFADLVKRPGPMVVAAATEITTGARFYFTQSMFDVLCSDLSSVRLSRAAASSSAVPVVLSPVTFNNYGGRCDIALPQWMGSGTPEDAGASRAAARAQRERQNLLAYRDAAQRPYLHLVDGGVSDNLATREVQAILDEIEARSIAGLPTGFEGTRSIAIVIVNAMPTPKLLWDQNESAPGSLEVLLQATGVPIDFYSYESIDQLRDTAARWRAAKAMRASGALPEGAAFRAERRMPDIDLHVIEIAFDQLADAGERDYLRQLPTSFALPPEAVARLRRAAGVLLRQSADFQAYLRYLQAGAPAR
ncbi:MAG: patatin-like phospholipase family protein [Proteobacteria bacterium]|nr:patatin-like phospholipase family protein [Pseudomonadota bacterium]